MKAHPGQCDPAPRFDLEGRVFQGCGINGDDFVIPDVYETCSVCGSISVNDLLRAFVTHGTQYQVFPWDQYPLGIGLEIPTPEYHEPFLLKDDSGVMRVEWAQRRTTSHKFLTNHLRDATRQQLSACRELIMPLTGILFDIEQETRRLIWAAAGRGFTTYGEIPSGVASGAPPVDVTLFLPNAR